MDEKSLADIFSEMKEIIADFALEVETFAQDRLDAKKFDSVAEEVALEDLRNRSRNMRTEYLEEMF